MGLLFYCPTFPCSKEYPQWSYVLQDRLRERKKDNVCVLNPFCCNEMPQHIYPNAEEKIYMRSSFIQAST